MKYLPIRVWSVSHSIMCAVIDNAVCTGINATFCDVPSAP